MISPTDMLQARILIVDDQKADISLLEQMLHDAGYVSITSTMDPRGHTQKGSTQKGSRLEGLLPKSDSRPGPIVGACLQAIFWICVAEDRLQAGSYIHCGTPKSIWATGP